MCLLTPAPTFHARVGSFTAFLLCAQGNNIHLRVCLVYIDRASAESCLPLFWAFYCILLHSTLMMVYNDPLIRPDYIIVNLLVKGVIRASITLLLLQSEVKAQALTLLATNCLVECFSRGRHGSCLLFTLT